MHRIAILVPAYNNAATLPAVIDGIKEALTGESFSLFAVDDGSTDGTVRILDRYFLKWNEPVNPNPDFHYVCRHPNEGVGAATQAGLKATLLVCLANLYEMVIKLDGDGQHNPEMLPEIVHRIRNGADLVIASRFHKNSDQIATPIDRILLNTMFASAITKITGWQITDARSGFMGMKMEFAQRLADRIITRRYGIPMEIILRLWKEKPEAKIEEVPHSAYYGGARLTKKQKARYQPGGETIEQKASRAAEAYAAVLRVLEDMKIDAKQILR